MKLETSIIIPTYNKAGYLTVVLTAIFSQIDESFEVIVVDDGSTDKTKDAARSFDVNYIRQEHNGFGLARARNNGACIAKSDYLIFLDDDIKPCSNYLEKTLEGKEKYGDHVVQAGYIWDYTGKGDPDIRTQFGVWDRPGILTKRFYQINGGNFALYKSLYWMAGGNDQDMVHGGVEDTLFGYLVSLVQGTSVVYNREMESYHLPHPKTWGEIDESANWEIVQIKYPIFYHDFKVIGNR